MAGGRSPISGGISTQVVTASPVAFATLSAVLADSRIGQIDPQVAVCSGRFPTSQGDSGTIAVTWYSRGLRKVVFVAEVNSSSPPDGRGA